MGISTFEIAIPFKVAVTCDNEDCDGGTYPFGIACLGFFPLPQFVVLMHVPTENIEEVWHPHGIG